MSPVNDAYKKKVCSISPGSETALKCVTGNEIIKRNNVQVALLYYYLLLIFTLLHYELVYIVRGLGPDTMLY